MSPHVSSYRPLPGMIVTGASGFVGRHLLEALKTEWRIFAIARRSQARSGAPVHPNITWFQCDIGDRVELERVFDAIRTGGRAEVCIHLAAHYDFTGEEHAEYTRTNVHGLRHVLDLCRAVAIRHFVFSSSVAACDFPAPGAALDERSPANGTHIYARTKRAGEAMLESYAGDFHSVIPRFAAMFSDWCEYPPLFMFIRTWLSSAWNAHLLGGRGQSAIPYLHVADAVLFFRQVLDRLERLPQGQVLVASPDGAVSHEQLFTAVTREMRGAPARPIHVPRALCGPGMHVMDAVGRVLGERPFERPWMAGYVDKSLTVNGAATRELLGWAPRPRLEILRRMPFLLENLKTDPVEWNRRNRAAMKRVYVRSNLRLHQLLERHEEALCALYTRRLTAPEHRERFASYQRLPREEHDWNHRLALRSLMGAVRTRERAVFVEYCRDLAERRFRQGFSCEEVCGALEMLGALCLEVLHADPESEPLRHRFYDEITMTVRFGVDQAADVFDEQQGRATRGERRTTPDWPPPPLE